MRRATASKRRERITFETKTRLDDSYGGFTTSWASPAPPNDQRFAHVSVRSAREVDVAGTTTPIHKLRFTIVYDKAFWDLISVGEWRILYQGRVFDVMASLPDPQHRSIEIHGDLHA